MPDELASLAEQLLELARAQGHCLTDQDWDGFAQLADHRLRVCEQMMPHVAGRADLQATLAQVAQLDAEYQALLASAQVELDQEWQQVKPQQAAVLAYFQGEKPPATEARFFDRRD